MRVVFSLLFLLIQVSLWSQSTKGLQAYYSFDDCNLIDNSGNQSPGLLTPPDSCDCGVSNKALFLFNPATDAILTGSINSVFDLNDFTVSFYFKPVRPTGNQVLMSRRSTCTDNNVFSINYTGSSGTIDVKIQESPTKQNNMRTRVEAGRCWHHVVITRKNNVAQLWLNGRLKVESKASGRVKIGNNGLLLLGRSNCLGVLESPFDGFLDELRIYNRPLSREEILELDLRPDQLSNFDIVDLFLGDTVATNIPSTCADQFNWTPATGVLDPTRGETTIKPTAPGTFSYRITMSDLKYGCVAIDTIQINVIDPDSVDCKVLYLPTAFTPNDDGLNDFFRISNYLSIDELESFEIFDRWGNRVFSTNSLSDAWDGKHQGQAVNPGVFAWKVIYTCQNGKQTRFGKVTVIR